MTNSDSPKVSIITPVLNQVEFIETCIQSVLSQDYPHVEYWVMDGGSTDGTLDVIRRYEGKLRWASENDKGQSSAINKGFRLAGGDILSWLNADDLLYPSAVSAVVEAFHQSPEVAVIYGDCDYVDPAGNVLGAYPARPFDYAALLVRAENYIPQPAAFFRKEVLESVGSLNEDLHYVMDFEYWLRIGARHPMKYLPIKLAALRLQPAAKTLSSIPRFGEERVAVYQRLFERREVPAELLPLKDKALANVYLRAAHSAFWGREVHQARGYLRQFIAKSPLGFLRPSFLKLAMFSAFGKKGNAIATKLRGNPYRRGLRL